MKAFKNSVGIPTMARSTTAISKFLLHRIIFWSPDDFNTRLQRLFDLNDLCSLGGEGREDEQ